MDRERRKLMKPLEILDRYKYVLLVAALGGLLLIWPSGKKTAEIAEKNAVTGVTGAAGLRTADAREMEEAMEAILAEISGVGRVDVMLTLHSGSELVLAEDGKLRYSGSVQSPDSYERSADTVTVAGDVVVTREVYPQYRGALVVCDGGGNDKVRLAVVDAVSALTGLGADRIAVVKWTAEPENMGNSGNTAGN